MQLRRAGDTERRFGRVDHVFVLDNNTDRHIFVILTPIKRTKTRHELLDLEIMEEEEDALVVGLPAIQPVRLYMVTVKDVGIVWVDWDVYML